jgi:hypothetical protein
VANTTHSSLSALTTVLSTELNSLASGSATAASTAFDNTTNKHLFADIELNLAAQGANRTAGANISVYMVHATDGTNYGDVNATTAQLVAYFPLDLTTTARRATVTDVAIPPLLVKFFAVNNTGQALAASGSTIKVGTRYVVTA